MEIVETSVFTKQVRGLLPDDEYRKLQAVLARRPKIGKVIRGSGGIRKTRWALPGGGRRGGVRVIYYWAASRDTLLMLLMYSKGGQDELSHVQLKTLRSIVEEEYS